MWKEVLPIVQGNAGNLIHEDIYCRLYKLQQTLGVCHLLLSLEVVFIQ